jgi:hypothetical protein
LISLMIGPVLGRSKFIDHTQKQEAFIECTNAP